MTYDYSVSKVGPIGPITWTTARETWITSVFVGIMVVVAALFLQLVDLFLGWSLSLILNFANGG